MHESWQKVCILKGCRKKSPPEDLNVPLSHPNSHPVNPKKIAALQKMIPFLPPLCRDFYNSIADHPAPSNSNDD